MIVAGRASPDFHADRACLSSFTLCEPKRRLARKSVVLGIEVFFDGGIPDIWERSVAGVDEVLRSVAVVAA
jgi:hypothetical protein